MSNEKFAHVLPVEVYGQRLRTTRQCRPARCGDVLRRRRDPPPARCCESSGLRGRRNLGWEPTRPVTLPESRTGRFFCRLYHGCDFLQTVSVGDDNTTRTMQTIVDTEHAASPRTPHCCLEDTTHATAATIVTLDSNFDSQWRMRIRLTGPFTARTTALYNSLLTA